MKLLIIAVIWGILTIPTTEAQITPVMGHLPQARNAKQTRITCYKSTGYPTASGLWPEEGMVATSDRTIPFGKIIDINGTKYTVEDRTNKRIKNTVDVFKVNCNMEYGVSFKMVVFDN